ncbi:hypothetical protein FKQ51_32070 [Bacillus toyonensis]|uniref:hypothetical protein n=1 Tax=Bacillus toyonensis TaxID=155322 RepID=UPI00270BEF5B|nr:hypothetical protein [Bacillus toyonensis]MDO8161787.1 hypothetical protein [Bacillus toyonensis]
MIVQKEKVTRRVVCRKCKSDQVVGNKRGYNFRRMFSSLFCLFTILIISFCLLLRFDTPEDHSVEGIFGFTFTIIVFLGFPVTIFSGLVGRKNIVNGCMNCGYTWMPKK